MLTGCEERHNDIGQKIILVAKKELMKGGRVNTIPYENLPDDALQKYVGKGSPLYDRQYVPTDLVKLQSSQTLQIQGERSLRQEAYEHLSQLSLAFYEYFHQPIVVMSAYRSYYHQKNQIAESCKANGYCAKEGESEHQL
jgi:LAS superfamily LD-carboxypeptidase LdcB